MKKLFKRKKGITLVALIVTVIVLLLLAGIAIATLGGKNGLFSKVKQSKEKYAISEAKEKLELEITNLQIEQEGKGEELKKDDLPKMNSDEIDVRNTTNFPVEVIYKSYRFQVDENFQVTYLGEANSTIITYTTNPEGYTNKDKIKVTVTISNPKGIKLIVKPGETDGIVPQNQTAVGVDFDVTQNGHYILKVVDTENNELLKDIYIDQIDKLEPLDFTISAKVENKKIIISGSTQDAEAKDESTKSGIDYYEYYLVDTNKKVSKFTTNEIATTLVSKGNYDIYAIAYDRAGNKKQSNTTQVTVTRKTKTISAGRDHTLVIDDEGNLWACGHNDVGQVGDGTTEDKLNFVNICTGKKFKQIYAGQWCSLAIDDENCLFGWGLNYYGTCGYIGGDKEQKVLKPVKIQENLKFKNANTSMSSTLAIDYNGNLWGCGVNDKYQLGNRQEVKKYPEINLPLQIEDKIKFKQVVTGYYHSMALDEEDHLWTWGINPNGELGDGTKTNRASLKKIKEDTKFIQISANFNEGGSLAIDSEGTLWGWGKINGKSIPTKMSESIKFTQVSLGDDYILAIDDQGNLWVYGDNNCYQLGDGTSDYKKSFKKIKEGTKFVQVAAGLDSSFAIDIEGNLWAWGSNGYGNYGDGTQISRKIPKQIIY